MSVDTDAISRPAILTFIGTYLPGYKAGGALRTVANMVEALSDEFRFLIVSSDRDAGDESPYPTATTGEWVRAGRAEVLYLGPGQLTVTRCREVMAATPHDVVYLQSCFSTFTIKPLAAMKLARTGTRAIVAPRGEFYPGALSIRRFKKICFLKLTRMCGFYSRVLWQASNEDEAREVRKWFGADADVMVAPDLASKAGDDPGARQPKRAGNLRVVYLSRIAPKKNLAGALKVLSTARGEIVFDIFGPAEDEGYWRECQEAISRLPKNIEVNYRGTVEHERVAETLAEYDLFLFPTLGENFGHVILEALSAGCPVLIGDQTPWRGLRAAGAGWDLPVEDEDGFVQALQECVDMPEQEHVKLRSAARRLGLKYAGDARVEQANRDLLNAAVKQTIGKLVPGR